MHNIVKNLLDIQNNIKDYLAKSETKKLTKVIAVSKTFDIQKILPLINYGHLDYGENKVQEAIEKWTEIKKNNKEIKLHMIGRLQTNKVKFAVQIFDYIHSVDNEKLAKKISDEMNKINRSIKIFIQVNIGRESQKSGVDIKYLEKLFIFCKEIKLNVIGLMCIPPENEDPQKYFKEMELLNKKYNLKELSMGMSADYIEALEHSSTYLRIGSNIFGKRN